MKIKVVSFIICCFTSCLVFAQEGGLAKVTEFFEFELHNKSSDSSAYTTKIVMAPIIAFEPSTSLQFGVGSKLLFKFKNATPETRTSNFPVSVKYTLKKQFLVNSEFTLFTNNENFLIKGGSKFLKFPFSYYGKGNQSLKSDKIEVDIHNFLFEPLVLKRVYGKLFVGGGLRYNSVWKAKLLEEGHGEHNDLIESINSNSSGLEIASTIDSRDNVLNAYNGSFVEFTHGFYSKFLGGTNKFMITKLDARKYYEMKNKKDVLAFHFFSRFTSGNTPLSELSSLGGKEILRGYPEQRYNDAHAVFFQTEYRWQAFHSLGVVFYSGAGDVFSNVQNDLAIRNLKYSLGTGLRIKIVQSENLNIRLDYAFGMGPSNDHNFYLGLAEAF